MDRGTTLIILLSKISLSIVTLDVTPKPTPKAFRFGAQKPIPYCTITCFHRPQALWNCFNMYSSFSSHAYKFVSKYFRTIITHNDWFANYIRTVKLMIVESAPNMIPVITIGYVHAKEYVRYNISFGSRLSSPSIKDSTFLFDRPNFLKEYIVTLKKPRWNKNRNPPIIIKIKAI